MKRWLVAVLSVFMLNFASLSQAQVAHEETQTGVAGNSRTVTTSASVTVVNGQFYLAAITTKPKLGVTAVSGLGLSWTPVKAQCSGRNKSGVEVWMAQGTPRSPVQRDAVTATLADTAVSVIIAVSRYSGVLAVNPIGSVISGNTNGSNGVCTGRIDNSSYSFNLTTTENGTLVYGVATMGAKNHTPGAGYAERVELQQGSGSKAVSLAVEDKNIASAFPQGGIAVNGSFNGLADWAVVALEVRAKPYTLTVNTLGLGSVSVNPPGGVYNAGTVVTLTAIPQGGTSGYVFSGYSGDFKGWMNVETITMDANKNLTATFSPLPKPRYTQGIWTSAAELKQLPTSGLGWDNLKAGADKPIGRPNLSDLVDSVNVAVLAKALVYSRTGNQAYRQAVISACMAAIGTEKDGETLALGRNLLAYVLAADLVGLPANEDARFRNWLRNALTKDLKGQTLRSTQETRANNWGTRCGATRAAIAKYLGDATELERTARVFKGWLGDRNTYADFSYEPNALSWQADPNAPVGINPLGATIRGHSVDGVLPEDQRRAGGFIWPPPKENYVYGALQGALMEAIILYRSGYDVWNWEDEALRRALKWLYNVAKYPANDGDDQWLPHIINHYYKTSFPTPFPADPGKNAGWTDWLYGSTYALTVSSNHGGVAIHSLGAVHDNLAIMQLTAIPDAGYVFGGWRGDLSGAKNPDTLIMNANKNVAANFVKAGPFTVTVTSAGSGAITLNPPGGVYPGGAAVTLTANPEAGFKFTGWSGDLSGLANPTTMTMDANKKVTANFSVNNDGGIPAAFQLQQNYPNPFSNDRAFDNPNTLIKFSLPVAGNVTLSIYNEMGQLVRRLVNRKFARGAYQINWDGRNESGRAMVAGVYLYQIVVKGENGNTVFMQTRRMTLM